MYLSCRWHQARGLQSTWHKPQDKRGRAQLCPGFSKGTSAASYKSEMQLSITLTAVLAPVPEVLTLVAPTASGVSRLCREPKGTDGSHSLAEGGNQTP